MPIVINELVIRGTVEPPAGNNGTGRPAGAAPGGPAESGTLDSNEREALVAACVEAVLRALERMKER